MAGGRLDQKARAPGWRVFQMVTIFWAVNDRLVLGLQRAWPPARLSRVPVLSTHVNQARSDDRRSAAGCAYFNCFL